MYLNQGRTVLVLAQTFKLLNMKIYKTIFITFWCLSFASCKKYLDIKVNNNQVFIETAQDCQLLLDNYSIMNLDYPSDGEASAGEYYLNDAAYSTQNAEDQLIYTWNRNAVRDKATPQWRNTYFIIYNANLVLETLEKLKGKDTPQAALDNLRGQALFFRSYCIWQILQLYANQYTSSSANQDLGVPIRLTSDINEVSFRGTLQQAYDRVVLDLKESANLLFTSVPSVSRPGKAAAYAMLARVYLSMGNYPLTLENVDSALQLQGSLLDYNSDEVNKSPTTNTPFSRFNKEVIFHTVMVNSPLLNPGSESNPIARINPAIVSQYELNDLRRIVFLKQNKTAGVFDGTYRFTGNYEQSSGATLFNGLATDELYLTRAECYARLGNISAAMNDLNTLLKTRWLAGTYVNKVALNADEALVIILAERRKELLMRGQRWTDLRRLNREGRSSVALSRIIQGETYSLPPNDLRFTILIPNEVIINSPLQQNPR